MGGERMAVKAEDIKVIVNYPEELYLQEEIENLKSKWIFDRQIELYGEENLNIVYPLWIKLNETKLKDSKI